MSKPVVFLDIDGVLVTQESLMASAARKDDDMCDRACVANLNDLLDASEAEIVISSTWRIIHTLDYIRSAFIAAGFKHGDRIVGQTEQRTHRTEGGVIVGAATRADEIREWLSRNPRERFVVIDDDLDAEIAGHYVRTSMANGGLSAAHVRKALHILGADVEAYAQLRTRGKLRYHPLGQLRN